MNQKIIATNRGALVAKYGTAGMKSIKTALNALVQADKLRALTTRVVFVDDAKQMQAMGAVPVANAGNCRENKTAIDAIFKFHNPAYLMILGAPDVIPHQDIRNPVYVPQEDDDVHAWSDLPYACEAKYSRDSARFVGPTRVVSRLPDMQGAASPAHLIALLKTAAASKPAPASQYKGYFGLSADVWKGSTKLSLEAVFGDSSRLRLSPPSGPAHPAGVLGTKSHFINCHGSLASPEFQGQKGASYPVALTSAKIAGRISAGTIAAVECCYGAELYDSVTLATDDPICQSYLKQGALAYFGSTTIAYGPADTNGAADLICQYFLLHVLAGASIGRAALLARQEFVQQVAQMDAIDLKTLSQFIVLGDPSVQPVVDPQAQLAAKSVKAANSPDFARAERRAKLKSVGEYLSRTKPVASKRVKAPKVANVARTALANIAKSAGLPQKQPYAAYAVTKAQAPGAGGAKAAAGPLRYFIALGTPTKGAAQLHHSTVAVVAKEMNGRIVDYRIYQRR